MQMQGTVALVKKSKSKATRELGWGEKLKHTNQCESIKKECSWFFFNSPVIAALKHMMLFFHSTPPRGFLHEKQQLEDSTSLSRRSVSAAMSIPIAHGLDPA